MIAKQEAPHLGLQRGIDNGGLEQFIFRLDIAKDRGVEMPRELEPVTDCGDARDDLGIG